MSQRHHPHPHGGHDSGGTQAEVLDLDAQMLTEHMASVIAWLPIRTAPSQVVDLGAGTGAGTFALLSHFPRARVIAVDSSAEHLEILLRRAHAQGLADRVQVVQADLDATGWPDLGTPDLVWAAGSMHHLADPDRAIRNVAGLLEADGLFVVVELAGLPRFLPASAPAGRPGLEERCHAAIEPLMSAHMPHRGADWGPKLATGRLLVEASLRIDAEIEGVANPAVGPYALAALTGLREAAAAHLSSADLEALDRLLQTDGPDSILGRHDLVARTRRTVWAARRTSQPAPPLPVPGAPAGRVHRDRTPS